MSMTYIEAYNAMTLCLRIKMEAVVGLLLIEEVDSLSRVRWIHLPTIASQRKAAT